MDQYQFADASGQFQQNNATWENNGQPSGGQRGFANNSYLNANQQDLLVAALNSQANGRQNTQSQAIVGQNSETENSRSQQQSGSMNGMDSNGVFISPTEAEFDSFGGEYTPDLDYLDDGFDFENADLGGEMIGALPGAGDSSENLAEGHEKRKYSDDDGGNAKRQETGEGEKGAKKPGRKPLTSEPTTVCFVRSIVLLSSLT